MPLNLNLQQNLQALGVWRVVFFFSCSIYWSIDVFLIIVITELKLGVDGTSNCLDKCPEAFQYGR